jgi:hypothetical protein
MMGVLINPLNIPYQFQHYNKQASREAADPTLIFFKGRYYLFASMSGGFYYSDDMLHWDWHENRELTPFRYAPDVRQVGDWLIFSSSDRDPSAIYRSKDPLNDDFEKISEPFPFWDPNTFQDEDGRVYFYWGCANTTPIYGQEFDPETMTPIGEKKELVFGAPDRHGWERPDYPGRPKEQGKEGLAMRLYRLAMHLSGSDKKPFIEGAFMNKWNGKYYLQYAAPGTELATYGDGVYVGGSPLGPFTYQAHNPFSSKPGGFITGAGHGSTIEDAYGNLWHASTMRISVNANFERRLGLFPAGLDRDGLLFCNQNFADYPLEIPEGKFDPHSIKPKWMLLSYKKNVAASSYREGHEPVKALDEDIRSCWCARGSAGEWYRLDLGDVYEIHGIQLNFSDVEVPMLEVDKSLRSNVYTSNRYIDPNPTLRTRYLLEGSADGSDWFVLTDKRSAETNLPHDYLELDGVKLRFVRVTAEKLPYDEPFALSGLRVFGLGNDAAPEAVKAFDSVRSDTLTEKLSWKAADRAIGYNVRFGIAPDKLYSSHMVYGQTEVLLTTLNAGQSYYAAVDAFGEGGVTEGECLPLQ